MVKFVYCSVLALLTLAAPLDAEFNLKWLYNIFGTPSSTQKPTTTTENPTTLTSIAKHLDTCKCVPYYLCEADWQEYPNPRIEIDGEEQTNNRICQNVIEVCCKLPKDPPQKNLKSDVNSNTEGLGALVTESSDVKTKFGEFSPEEKVKPESEEIEFRGCGYNNPEGLGATVTESIDNEAKFGEFPWVVAVLECKSKLDIYTGVGVLIHPQVVMTAAHIATKYSPETMKIRAGEWDTQFHKEMYDYQERYVQEIYVHTDFKQKSLKNDIALLRLQSPLKLAKHINTLCLPNQDEVFDGYKNCAANGWGKENFGLQGRYSVILKKVLLDMVPHERCNDLLKRTRLGSNFTLHDSFICAGGEEGKDTCKGDGGAPLACPVGNNRYKLSGLVAWGIGCGEKDVPAVYVSVATFRQWVDDKMNQWGYNGNATYALSAHERK